MKDQITHALNNLRTTRPLILNVTNYVTMDFVANGLLSLGASPIMSVAKNETRDLLKLVRAVALNLGTLNDDFISYCTYVCEIANELDVPIILDPVGAGASEYRTETCKQLLDAFSFSMIRGNASEIMALTHNSFTTCGVDSTLQSEMAFEAAQHLSNTYNTVVVVSGKKDIIVNQQQFVFCEHGSPLMPKVTGSGCLLTAVLAAFRAVDENCFQAASIGTHFYGLSGEKAALTASGPASFKVMFLDTLSSFAGE